VCLDVSATAVRSLSRSRGRVGRGAATKMLPAVTCPHPALRADLSRKRERWRGTAVTS